MENMKMVLSARSDTHKYEIYQLLIKKDCELKERGNH